MIGRIFSNYRELGPLKGTKQNLMFVLRRMGYEITRSADNNPYTKKANKIFEGRGLKDSGEGYWYVDPMPSTAELDDYYKFAYWKKRGGKTYGALGRDFIHWCILTEYLGDFFDTPKTAVNFGAGYGGVSNILWTHGHTVVNVEPSEIPDSYNTRWTSVHDVSEVASNSADLFYGSHSLEHVPDLEAFTKEVKRILKPGGYVFWEVPNGAHSENALKTNEIVIPHTYYFSKDYFDHVFEKVLLNDTFDHSHKEGIFENWRDFQNQNGVVIRCLGQFRDEDVASET